MTAAADQVIDAAASIAANYTGGMWRIPARSATIRLKPGTNLAAATVMVGDAYALTVSDESLTEVVRRHVDKAKLDIAADEPILQSDGLKAVSI